MNPRCFRLFVTLLIIWIFTGQEIESAERVPILLDTDMGAAIDDAFALGLALGSYELDVCGITTVGDDAQQKAMLLCRFLTMTGRRNIRVAVGSHPQPPRPITKLHPYYYHPDALFNRTTKPEKESAVDFLHARLKEQPGKTTLVCLGPLTNLARLIETHAEAPSLIQRVILVESNLALDIAAAQKVFATKVPLIVLTTDASRNLLLDERSLQKVFRPGTALSRQVEALYQMWDQADPPLNDALAVSLCLENSWCKFENNSFMVDDHGKLIEKGSDKNVRLLTSIENKPFVEWYTERMASLVAPEKKPSRVLIEDQMPYRVHVAEDFDNDIERRWWMSGKPEVNLLPAGSRRACRGVLTHDFDDLLMVSRQMYSAVIFNPVPGPPMSKNTRLSIRYWLKGTDTIRVQIYSLTNGYHRHLVITGLPQESWQATSVDMTEARRPDGTGGPLSENERIDDIQFYIDPDAEIVIDDIVLYEAPVDGEMRPFPRRIFFTGGFDTGKQGENWPGEFKIVSDAGNFWRAISTVDNVALSSPWIRLHLRGQCKLGDSTELSFRYRLTGTDHLHVKLLNSETGRNQVADVQQLKEGAWTQTTIKFATGGLTSIDELHIHISKNSELLVDDVLLYEPG